jgi:hypothetical protein
MAEQATESAVGFTPGPWWFDKLYGLVYAGQKLVAEPYGDDIRGPHPNAHLIAAAPDLLAALQGIAKMDHTDTCSNSLSSEYDCTCHVTVARAAVAKATPPLQKDATLEASTERGSRQAT